MSDIFAKKETAESKKLKDASDPFGMGDLVGGSSGAGMSINLGGEDATDNSMNKKEADARLKELANRKAISSEDFVNY